MSFLNQSHISSFDYAILFTTHSFEKNLFEAIDTCIQLLPDDQVKEIDSRIAGHLMVIKKEIWLKIREEVSLSTMNKHILGVYTKISKAILVVISV